MMFLVILVAATTAAAAIRRRGDTREWARLGLAVAFVFAGIAHLVDPVPFEQHLPEWTPGRLTLVYATGVAEIVLGAALAAWRADRRSVGRITAAYLVAVWPANIYVAVAGVDVDGLPQGTYPWIRLPFQVLFIAWALWSTRTPAPVGPDDPGSRTTRGVSMPPLPWTKGRAEVDAMRSESVYLASRIQLQRFRDLPGFLAAAMRLRSVFRAIPGGRALSLHAQPLRRTFWTLSAWVDDDAVAAFARHPEHTAVMRRFHSLLVESTFVTWAGTAPVPTWDDARTRVTEAARDRSPSAHF